MVNSSSSVTENQLEDGSVHSSDASKVQENESTCKTRSCKKRKAKVSIIGNKIGDIVMHGTIARINSYEH